MAEGTIGGTPISQLPPSSFAYCEPGNGAVSTRCHFPIRDKNGKADPAHVRNALARLSGSPFEAKARPKVEAAAKELGIGQPAAKALMPVKAKALDPDEQTAWFDGKIARRLLAIPFGGPIPAGAKAPYGVDYDGEWFGPGVDIYGGVRALRDTRERLVDFHHSYAPPDARYGDPTQLMTGAVLGKSILDPDPEEDGWWVDFWLKAGDKRVKMIQALAERGAQLFGSSQPIPGKARRNPDTGEITVWPFVIETLSTSPSNTYSVLRPAKAMLEDIDTSGIAVGSVMRGLIAEMRDLDADLRRTSLAGDDGAKSGRELSSVNDQEIEAAIAELDEGYSRATVRLRGLLERARNRYQSAKEA